MSGAKKGGAAVAAPAKTTDEAILAARAALKDKFTNAGAIGGKGSVRRKVKVVHKTASTDDKRLNATLKRLNVNPIPGIEEVNIYLENGTVMHFDSPKLQAALPANTYVVTGTHEIKQASEFGTGAMDKAAQLRQLQAMMASSGKGGAAGMDPKMIQSLMSTLSGGGGAAAAAAPAEDDEAMPELSGDFETPAAAAAVTPAPAAKAE